MQLKQEIGQIDAPKSRSSPKSQVKLDYYTLIVPYIVYFHFLQLLVITFSNLLQYIYM